MRRPGLVLRCGLGLLFLLLLGRIESLPFALPGANLFNASVLGVLGAPGFALLLLLPVVLS